MARSAAILYVIIALTAVGSASAQTDLIRCCKCDFGNAIGYVYTTREDCNACGDKAKPLGFAPCPPGLANPATVFQNVKWSIARGGAMVWTGPDQATLITGPMLRDILVGSQEGISNASKEAIATLKAAPIEVLEKATRDGLVECKAENNIKPNIQWVADKWGLSRQMWRAYQEKNVPWIRTMYHDTQAKHGDPKNANILNCYSGPEVLKIVAEMGDPGPEPVQQKPPKEEKVHTGGSGDAKPDKPDKADKGGGGGTTPDSYAAAGDVPAAEMQSRVVAAERKQHAAEKSRNTYVPVAAAIALIVGFFVGRRFR